MGRSPHPKNQMRQKSTFPRLYGRHAVFAALDNPERAFRKLWLTPATSKTIVVPQGLQVQIGDDHDLGRMCPPDAPHQGFVLEVEPLENVWLGDILKEANDGDNRPIIVLDQVTDPHNVGAIFRSCAAFNVTAVVTTARHSAETTGVLFKAASGATELVPFVKVTNLARAMAEMKEYGFRIIGLDSDAPAPIETEAGKSPLVLVLGAEGKGLRQLTRDNCDALVKLDLPGAIKSLNVSNAAALALYAVTRKPV